MRKMTISVLEKMESSRTINALFSIGVLVAIGYVFMNVVSAIGYVVNWVGGLF